MACGPKQTLEEGFNKFVIRNSQGCWDWKGYKNKQGYGNISFEAKGKLIGAHRASWLIHKGPIPKGMWVLHACDWPPCSKITESESHLFLGDAKINSMDMMTKGRGKQPKGENCHKSKLSTIQVQEIKKLLKINMPIEEIATKFNMSLNAIKSIKNNITWKHIKD